MKDSAARTITVQALLTALRQDDVRLWTDDGRLHYEAPKGVMTEVRLAQICELKGEIIDLLREAVSASSQLPSLTAQVRPARLPLSYAQERLWLLEQIETLGSAYNIATAVRLTGRFDGEVFERALCEVVRRHEALRTRFAVAEDSAEQVIDASGAFQLERVDLSALEEAQRRSEAARVAREVARRPFDLVQGPLLRVALLRLTEEEHVAVVVMHHIVSDGWSRNVLIQEVGTLYQAYVEGRTSPLPALPIQYADYALWQRGWLQGEALERQVGYWKDRLAGAPAVLDLPTDRPRPAVQSFRGASVSIALPRALADGLDALARREGATLFMVLLAAFQVVLSRWSGQQDIVVGTPVAGRTDRRTEGLIGFFVNMLALRTDLSGDPSFRELLRRARETALGAYAHQDLPFEKLVGELNPVRDLSRPPVFQVMINAFFADGPLALELPELKVSPLPEEDISARFELMLRLQEVDEHLTCRFDYATALFDAATIERLAGHYRNVLAGIVADPGSCVSELPLLSEAERRQLLIEWGGALGRPNSYVLGHALAPVPVGVIGELYVGGADVARGDCGRPDLTAERLVPSPFGDGARLRRTGDLARWRGDGSLELLGPLDHQVKIRGYRIALGDIETALLSAPAVKQAVVLAREDRPGEQRLVGYVVAEGGAAVEAVALRAHVRQRLPDYMVPSHVVVLEGLPLTANGTLDRKALPAPDGGHEVLGFEAPRTPTEETLAEIWLEVLGVERIGIHDNFFELGGHSLLATLVMARLREIFGIELSLRSLFEAPTIALLAERLERTVGKDEADPLSILLPLRPQGNRPPLFCIHPLSGIAWPYLGLLQHLPDRPIYGLQALGLTGAEPLATSIDVMAADYLATIRSIQPAGPYNLLGWSFGCQVAHAIAAKLQDQGEVVALLAMLDGYPPDPRRPPLDRRKILAEIMTMIGYDHPLPEDELPTSEEIIAAGRRSGHPVPQSIVDHLQTVIDVVQNNSRLQAAFRPGRFRGDILHLVASRNRSAPSPSHEAWRRYVTGDIVCHAIDSTHADMTEPPALAQIGPILANALDRAEHNHAPA